MRKINLNSSALIYESIEELNDEDKKLILEAKNALKNAYAPYSKFNVGCALLLENGKIITGNNQENAAYPSGMCAERVAIWKASSIYPDVQVLKLAIAATSENRTVDKPVSPCGACRQTLSEYEIKQKKPIKVLFTGEIGQVVKTESVLSLLPFSFDSSYL